MPIVYMYDARDFTIDFRNGDGDTVYTSAPTADNQSSNIPYTQQITGGTMSMGGTQANIGSLDMTFEGSPIETSVDNANSGIVSTGKTLFGDTSIATGENVDFIYEIRIYDPANPNVQISLYAVARTDTYNGAPQDDNHEIIGFASQVPLDRNINYVVGDIYDNTSQAVRENIIETSELVPDPDNPVCFAAGTLISTTRGDVAVEDLCVGDLVNTKDNGLQEIRWIGSQKLTAAIFARAPQFRPIRIQAGALGDGIPETDLVVSPQHRILVRSRIALKMFDTDEVLVAAKQLCQIDGIDIADDLGEVEYFHMLFDQHEVVISNGAETESLYTGPEALKSIGPAALEEIFALFPELKNRDYTPVSAHVLASGRMGRKLAHRHAQNNKMLVN